MKLGTDALNALAQARIPLVGASVRLVGVKAQTGPTDPANNRRLLALAGSRPICFSTMIGLTRFIVAALFAALALPLLANNSSSKPPLEYFFAESTRFAERLSPDGTQVAHLGPDSAGIIRLWVAKTDEPKISRKVSQAVGAAVSAYFWIGSKTLLWQAPDSDCRARLFLGDSQGVTTRQILAGDPRIISLHGVVDSVEPFVLVGLSQEPSAYPDLYRVKLKNNDPPELVCANHDRIITWAWDEGGTPVAGLRWTAEGAKEILSVRGGPGRVIFHAAPADDARLLFATLDGLRVFVLTDRDADLTRVVSVELTTGKSETISADPLGRVDVDQVLADDRDRKILAMIYSDDSNRWQALDPAIDEMLKTVNHFSDTLHLTCVGFDSNRKHFLLKRYSDRDPGTVYLYDVAARRTKLLWRERPEMDRETLCKTQAYYYPARDGFRIPAYLTVPRDVKPPWPLVVFPHGGPRMRTSPGYDGRVQFLSSRGYAVLQPNFRGSRGYGKAFMNAGDGQWGKGVMQTDVTDGVDFLVRSGKVDRQRVAIFGGSYGGYAALAGLVFTPGHYAAGICLFGISDLSDYATVFSMESQVYAGDTVRRLGDPSTTAGRALLEELSPVNHASSITAPLLIYHGANDTLIPVSHARRMVAALESSGKRADYLLSPDEAHGFSNPESEMAVYRAIEVFLHEHLGGSVGPAPADSITHKLDGFRSLGQADSRHQ